MLIFNHSVELKHKISSALVLSCPDISPKGKEAFHALNEQFSELECQDWIFRSCFVKDGQVSDDCVIMRFGDMWPEEGLRGVSADVGAQKMFGSFARDAMLDRMILSVVTLILGRGSDESSLLNFANKHCPEAIGAQIKDALKIEEEIQEPRAHCPHCPHCKAKLKEKSPRIKYSCAIEGFNELKTYRDKRAAHRDLKYGAGDIRLQYRTIEDCIQRILQAIRVVYPDADFSVDWRKRGDIINRIVAPGPWTVDHGEPRIVQNLKELVIRRHWDKLVWLEGLVREREERLWMLQEELQGITLSGTDQSMQAKMDEIRAVQDEIRAVRARMDEICSEIEKVRSR